MREVEKVKGGKVMRNGEGEEVKGKGKGGMVKGKCPRTYLKPNLFVI